MPIVSWEFEIFRFNKKERDLKCTLRLIGKTHSTVQASVENADDWLVVSVSALLYNVGTANTGKTQYVRM